MSIRRGGTDATALSIYMSDLYREGSLCRGFIYLVLKINVERPRALLLGVGCCAVYCKAVHEINIEYS